MNSYIYMGFSCLRGTFGFLQWIRWYPEAIARREGKIVRWYHCAALEKYSPNSFVVFDADTAEDGAEVLLYNLKLAEAGCL